MQDRTTPRTLLVEMLHEAAELEHSLLNSYLFAACSIKATPQEWEYAGAQENRRRAPQFERARLWKAGVLEVAHEEMRHLHYVQCLIRALGERPHLGLPARGEDGVWVFANWASRIGVAPPSAEGTRIPVAPFGREALRAFVLFESTDALQDEDPFGVDAMALYRRLQVFEFSVRVEGLLTKVAEGPEKDKLRERISFLYTELPPVENEALQAFALKAAMDVPALANVRFQSIADLYVNGILPLYRQAFESGWVVANDRNLVDEQLDPHYAAEGFLPIGPVGRSLRFARFATANQQDPLRDYKRVDDIVEEIVEEGEGATMFRQRAEAMLAKAEEIGAHGFVDALARDARGGPGYSTPDWLAEAQLVRGAHLYRFAIMMIEHDQEAALCETSGLSFDAARAPLPPSTPELRKIRAELPTQFNAAYLGMLAWLARMYETKTWGSDKPRRMAIEMLATWPLMSLAVRPMLELATLAGCDPNLLFRFAQHDVPTLPVWAQELASIYSSEDRSEEINERMDHLVVRTLSAVASWATQLATSMGSRPAKADRPSLVLSRLKALGRLSEFEKQFPYRTAGGYSDRLPDLTYINTHPGSDDLSEAPALKAPAGGNPPPLFAATLVARLRFRGWGLVQLATDPDPPTDEAGVTGTLMLHPADGDRHFDRALVWQDYDPELNIRRPAPDAPLLGVQCCEIALMVADRLDGATAGYVPIGTMDSAGAVQTSGVQRTLDVQGLHPLSRLGEDDLRSAFGGLDLFLETKDGVRPYLHGENHLVWQDGEPVDPFILSVLRRDDTSRKRLLSREIYNRGMTIAQMAPYQRLLTSRGPVGFDTPANLPGWAKTAEVACIINDPGFPMSFLARRAAGLATELAGSVVGDDWTMERVDTAVSLVERLARVAQPRGTTIGWLPVLLHYGHTISGGIADPAAAAPLLAAIGQACGLELGLVAHSDRNSSNGRWLASYTKGVMDTDTLSDFVYGELYVPLEVVGGTPTFCREWSFPAVMADAVRGFALRFDKPFWATFEIDGDARSTEIAGLDPSDPSRTTKLIETLESASSDGYSYKVAPIAGVDQTGSFSLAVLADRVVLAWSCAFTAKEISDVVRWLALLASAGEDMTIALGREFAPS